MYKTTAAASFGVRTTFIITTHKAQHVSSPLSFLTLHSYEPLGIRLQHLHHPGRLLPLLISKRGPGKIARKVEQKRRVQVDPHNHPAQQTPQAETFQAAPRGEHALLPVHVHPAGGDVAVHGLEAGHFGHGTDERVVAGRGPCCAGRAWLMAVMASCFTCRMWQPRPGMSLAIWIMSGDEGFLVR